MWLFLHIFVLLRNIKKEMHKHNKQNKKKNKATINKIKKGQVAIEFVLSQGRRRGRRAIDRKGRLHERKHFTQKHLKEKFKFLIHFDIILYYV